MNPATDPGIVCAAGCRAFAPSIPKLIRDRAAAAALLPVPLL